MQVSGPGEANGHGEPPEGAGVLANLPRTRPQRATARRAAARSAQPDAGTNGNGRAPRGTQRKPAKKPAATAATTKPKPARPKAARAPRRRERDEVPRQGYESVEERATGPVQPPGGTEMIGTAAEIVSELAKAGISGGERVVRDLLSRLGR